MAAEKPAEKPTERLSKADIPVTHTGKQPVAPTVQEVDVDTPPAPVVATLHPSDAAVGDPSFILRVLGSGFTRDSVIVFAHQDEPTTFFSEHELTTGMNMPLWVGADPAIPCLVRNADGQTSNTVVFALAPPRAVPLDHAHASKPTPSVDQI